MSIYPGTQPLTAPGVLQIIDGNVRIQQGRVGRTPRGLRPRGYPITHTHLNGTGRFSNSSSLGAPAASQGIVTLRHFEAMASGTGLTVGYANWGAHQQEIVGPGWQENNVGNAVTVECAISDGTTWVPLTVSGVPNPSVPDGSHVFLSHPTFRVERGRRYLMAFRVTVANAAGGQRCWALLPDVGAGDVNLYVHPDTVATYASQSAVDPVPAIASLPHNIAQMTQSTIRMWAFPHVVLTTNPDAEYLTAPIVGIFGDSRAVGLTAAPTLFHVQRSVASGYLQEAAHRMGVPTITTASGGDRLDQMVLTARPRLVSFLREIGVTDAWIDAGTNDAGQGNIAGINASGLEIARRMNVFAGQLKDTLGVERVYAFPQQPRTGSSDAWETAANQTPVAPMYGRLASFAERLSRLEVPRVDAFVDTRSGTTALNGANELVWRQADGVYAGTTVAAGTNLTAVIDVTTAPWNTLPGVAGMTVPFFPAIEGACRGMNLRFGGQVRTVNRATLSGNNLTLRCSPDSSGNPFSSAIGAGAAITLVDALTTDGTHVSEPGINRAAAGIVEQRAIILPVSPRENSPLSPATWESLNLVPEYTLLASTAVFQDLAGTLPVAADGDPVGRWVDQVGGVVLTSNNDAGRAIWRPDRFGTGIGGIELNGSSSHLRVQSAPRTILRPLTMFVVCRFGADAETGQAVFGGGDRQFVDSTVQLGVPDRRINIGRRSTGFLGATELPMGAMMRGNETGIWATRWERDGTVRMWWNGVEIGSGVANRSLATQLIGLCVGSDRSGTSQFSQGSIHSLRIFRGAASEGGILAVSRGVCNSLGIPYLGLR